MKPPPHWEVLKELAQRVIEKTLAELPANVYAEAQKVPCLFEPQSEEDPDLLGLYAGDFIPGEISEANGPIILYLATIEDFCLDEGEGFADQIRLTYLHELGHYFGWDEGDLEERGLK